jgi:signal transduction histidine kinase
MDRSWLRIVQRISWSIVLIGISAGILAWSDLRAIREWQRSSSLLVEYNTEHAADLIVRALNRDMRAVQSSVLPSLVPENFVAERLHDARDTVATIFARYPYPEAFFAWLDIGHTQQMLFFLRFDRPPPWAASVDRPGGSSVLIETNDNVAKVITARLRKDIAERKPFSVFELMLDDRRHQIVARVHYGDSLRVSAEAVLGFIVNLSWVRDHYFRELTEQISWLADSTLGLAVAVVDDGGQVVGGGRSPHSVYSTRRAFGLSFFEPRLIELDPPADMLASQWLVTAEAIRGQPVTAAIGVANRILVLTLAAVVALVIGLTLTYRAVRIEAKLGDLRSEFVSTVTHELKSPIARIRMAGETLMSGRGAAEKRREYAGLVVRQATHLTRLVDNLLALSRITDLATVYAFEPMNVDEMVQAAVMRFRDQLSAGGFDIDVTLPIDLPAIWADSTSMALVLDNVMDNAIRYSGLRRRLWISGAVEGRFVRLDIRDEGCGIPSNEIDQVTRRFFRGRGVKAGGTGLGLAIVTRIVRDHGGKIAIQSTVGVGTTVGISLPLAEDDDEKPPFDR